mgnify:CR=1
MHLLAISLLYPFSFGVVLSENNFCEKGGDW